MNAGCIGYTPRSGSQRITPPRPCEAPVTTVITAGCEHEHIGERRVCDYHAADARRSNMLCGNCLEAPGREHDCWLTVTSETPAATTPEETP